MDEFEIWYLFMKASAAMIYETVNALQLGTLKNL